MEGSPQKNMALSPEHTEGLQLVFAMLDKNGTGQLEVKDLAYLLNKLLKRDLDDMTLGEILSEITDSDTPGQMITFDLFCKALGPTLKGLTSDEVIKRGFQVMDKDGSGRICAAELGPLMSATAGAKLRDAQIDEVLKIAAGADGTVQLADYKRVIDESDKPPTLHRKGERACSTSTALLVHRRPAT